MKSEVLQMLMTAKVLLNTAQDLCFVDDKSTASSGLIVLQDSLELTFLACLIEIGVDEAKNLGKISFDSLMSELKKASITIPKSGTLAAINKQRVIVKHYGQIAELSTVANYYNAGQYAINEVLKQIIGKTLQDVMLYELIRKPETRQFLEEAVQNLEDQKYDKVLENVRKAIYIEIEYEYCIYGWKDSSPTETFFEGIMRGGDKAPFYSKSSKWISENVDEPFKYVQLDHNCIRQDLMEWGANTQDFFNIWRLTPSVVSFGDSGWLVEQVVNEHVVTEETARYCLDRAVTLLSKKQAHLDLGRYVPNAGRSPSAITTTDTVNVYNKALTDSEVLETLSENIVFQVNSIVPGLDGLGKFAQIFTIHNKESEITSGFIEFHKCKMVDESEVEAMMESIGKMKKEDTSTVKDSAEQSKKGE